MKQIETMLTLKRQLVEEEILKTRREWGISDPIISDEFNDDKTETQGRQPSWEDSAVLMGPAQQPYLFELSRFMSHTSNRSA